MSDDNKFLRITSVCLWVIVALCITLVAFNVIDNLHYANKGVSTTGIVIEFKLKRGSTSAGNSNVRLSQTAYPIVEYLDDQGIKQRFTSTYSSRKFRIGDEVPIRYLNGLKPNERINTFSINWLFSIFATISLITCAFFIFVIRHIAVYYRNRGKYLSTLTGKCTAIVFGIEKFENGWNLLLEGPIEEQDKLVFKFCHFTLFESDHLMGKTFVVRYDPSDIERSYIVDIEHIYS